MLHDKAGGKQRVFIEAVQEGVAEHIGDLQLCAQQHGEDEENRHALIFKQCKSIQAQHAAPALFCLLIGDRNVRQRQREQRQHHGERSTNIELHMAQFEAGKAHRPHRQNKADGAPNTDRREVGHDIQAG